MTIANVLSRQRRTMSIKHIDDKEERQMTGSKTSTKKSAAGTTAKVAVATTAKSPPKKSQAAKAVTAVKKPAIKTAVDAKAAPKKAPAKATVARARKPKVVPAEQRRNYIEMAAYYIAERRGFAPGNPLEDWVQAEAEIERLLAEGRLGG